MLPYPLLTVSIVLMWLLLNRVTPGHILLGTLVGIFASWSLAALRPEKPRFAKWYLLPKLFGIVLWDVLLSNLNVAGTVLRGGRSPHPPGFVTLPVESGSGVILSVMAMIVTGTPGSAWLEYNSNDRTVLIHVASLENATDWRDHFKNRYEKLLLEIFA
ncbi:monovalent cation/H+ antiporter subunit E [Rhizobium sp. KVB221]|uniref:Monovalent cation/H+ antiporter subunit E n=1 Tax=Rhizobium setariae TaxID=2801340 RepID=A0A936YV63_9HYPH|nr:Na+/H+ antiporter subunit E [Rhizobium setariae]MBL0373395.1 monovalent cation/H+ antiporter subunit E [Rhizobium setariae]